MGPIACRWCMSEHHTVAVQPDNCISRVQCAAAELAVFANSRGKGWKLRGLPATKHIHSTSGARTAPPTDATKPSPSRLKQLLRAKAAVRYAPLNENPEAFPPEPKAYACMNAILLFPLAVQPMPLEPLCSNSRTNERPDIVHLCRH